MSNSRNKKKVDLILKDGSSASVSISGSFTKARIFNTIIAYTARSSVGALAAPVTAMVNLNPVLSRLLATAPLISTGLTQIPMSQQIGKNGGKKAVLSVIVGTLTGMAALTVIASYTDITAINNFNLTYAGVLVASGLAGLGSGTFPLLVNSMQWAQKPEQLSLTQSMYSGIVDSSSITTPVVMYLLKPYGYGTAFGLYTGLIAIGGLLATKFLYPTPFTQLKKSYSNEQAKQLAISAGQLESMIHDDDNISLWSTLKKNFRFLLDRRGFVLNYSMFVILSNFFMTEQVLSILFTQRYKIGEGEAIFASAFANLITLLSRPIAGKIIGEWDHESGGIKIFEAGCALTILSAIPLTFSSLPKWALYTSVATLNVGFGAAIVSPLNIAQAWAKPVNEDLDEYNPNHIFGSLGTSGTLGGVLLPLVLGLMVNELGDEGYQYYFLLLIAMMMMTTISIPIVDFNVRHPKGEKFYDKPMMLFNRLMNRSSQDKYEFSEGEELENIEIEEDRHTPEPP